MKRILLEENSKKELKLALENLGFKVVIKRNLTQKEMESYQETKIEGMFERSILSYGERGPIYQLPKMTVIKAEKRNINVSCFRE